MPLVTGLRIFGSNNVFSGSIEYHNRFILLPILFYADVPWFASAMFPEAAF